MVRLVVHPQLCMVFPATVHISGHDKLAQGIYVDLKRRAYDLNSFSDAELGSISRKIAESKTFMQNVEKQAAYFERRTIDLNEI